MIKNLSVHLALLNQIKSEEEFESQAVPYEDKVEYIKKRIEQNKTQSPLVNQVCEIGSDNRDKLETLIKNYFHFKIKNFYVDIKQHGTEENDNYKLVVYEEIETKYPYFASRAKKRLNLTADDRFRKFNIASTGQFGNLFLMPEKNVINLFNYLFKADKVKNFI